MELMQRYIDDDLDQQETSLMMDHIGQCPDCAAMLARLQKLSSELEQLPRVVPRFSLVDAIMPELERLHASDSSGGSHNDSEVSESKPIVRSRRPARHLYGKIAGVVAAGVVAGLLLFSNPGQWTLGGSGSQNDAAGPEMSQPGVQAQRGQDPAAKITTNDVRLMDQSESKNGSDAGNGENGSNASGAENSGEGGSAGLAPPLNAPAPETPVEGSNEGFAPLVDIPATWAESADGQWKAIAVVDAGTFQVYKTGEKGEWYTSAIRDGKISLLSWNESSTILYFTFTDAGGTETQWQFDTATSTESLR
ncbi:anti-sigma factor family protein [Cohnella lupini]|nr:zf-HC2 domain-containing protein [Cohnella lupini]